METAAELSQTSTKDTTTLPLKVEGNVVATIEVPPPKPVAPQAKGKGGPKPKASQESVDAVVERIKALEELSKSEDNDFELPAGFIASQDAPNDPLCILVARVDQLTAALEKIATYSGHANHLPEFGMKRWEPQAKDMTKHHDG